MGVLVDPIDGAFLTDLAAEEAGVCDEEHLLLGVLLQAREELPGFFFFDLFPGVEGGAQPARVCNVLAQCQPAVDVQLLALRVEDREVGILVHEAFRLLLESSDGSVVPPVRVIARLVIVAAVGVEGCQGLVIRPYGDLASSYRE